MTLHNKFKVGDVVRLQSSSPWMTVSAIEDGYCKTVWISKKGRAHTGTFDERTLMLIHKTDKATA